MPASSASQPWLVVKKTLGKFTISIITADRTSIVKGYQLKYSEKVVRNEIGSLGKDHQKIKKKIKPYQLIGEKNF